MHNNYVDLKNQRNLSNANVKKKKRILSLSRCVCVHLSIYSIERCRFNPHHYKIRLLNFSNRNWTVVSFTYFKLVWSLLRGKCHHFRKCYTINRLHDYIFTVDVDMFHIICISFSHCQRYFEIALLLLLFIDHWTDVMPTVAYSHF